MTAKKPATKKTTAKKPAANTLYKGESTMGTDEQLEFRFEVEEELLEVINEEVSELYGFLKKDIEKKLVQFINTPAFWVALGEVSEKYEKDYVKGRPEHPASNMTLDEYILEIRSAMLDSLAAKAYGAVEELFNDSDTIANEVDKLLEVHRELNAWIAARHYGKQ